jgi:hypothetical protein
VIVRLSVSAFLGLLLSIGLLSVGFSGPAQGAGPIEDYASYDPGRACRSHPLPGTALLGRWVVRRYGGSYVSTTRPCGKNRRATSDHQAGRAFDWPADVRRKADRRRVRALLTDLWAADRAGNADARARRFGVMYVIWSDHIYEAWNEFRPEPYLSSSCKRPKRCSRTLRHRDHVHVSLSRAGARARTSGYDGRR